MYEASGWIEQTGSAASVDVTAFIEIPRLQDTKRDEDVLQMRFQATDGSNEFGRTMRPDL